MKGNDEKEDGVKSIDCLKCVSRKELISTFVMFHKIIMKLNFTLPVSEAFFVIKKQFVELITVIFYFFAEATDNYEMERISSAAKLF